MAGAVGFGKHEWIEESSRDGISCRVCGTFVSNVQLAMWGLPSQMLGARCVDQYMTADGTVLPNRPVPENCGPHLAVPTEPRTFGQWKCVRCRFSGSCAHGIVLSFTEVEDCSQCGATVDEIRAGRFEPELPPGVIIVDERTRRKSSIKLEAVEVRPRKRAIDLEEK